MFERFTERARQVVVLAQDEARALKHNYIGTEHLLLGLLREPEGVARMVLESLEISLDRARSKVVEIVGKGDDPVASGQIPFTPRAKKVLELSLREALALGHNHIGTEHILLGLARDNEGVAAQILHAAGADAERVRVEIFRVIGAGAGGMPSPHWSRRRFRRPHRWEYRIQAGEDELEAVLAGLGAEGWELVLRLEDGRLVFKRPAP